MIQRALILGAKALVKEGICAVLDLPFPEPPFNGIKTRVLNFCFGSRLAPDCRIWHGVRALNWRNVTIGKGVYISNRVEFRSHGPISIGEMSMIGTDATIISGGHRKSDLAPTSAPVHIGRGVFIGVRAVILEGVTVGDHAMIGAGAVVAGDVPSLAVVAGNPARIIGQRDAPEMIWSVPGMIALTRETPGTESPVAVTRD